MYPRELGSRIVVFLTAVWAVRTRSYPDSPSHLIGGKSFYVDGLPSLIQSSTSLEDLSYEAFGEVVCALILGWNPDDLDVAVLDLVPKVMPLDVVVFRSVGDLVFGGEGKSSVVVFVNCRCNLVLH